MQLNVISGPHGQIFAVCRNFGKCGFLFQNRTPPPNQPPNHGARGMAVLAFGWLCSHIPPAWTDLTEVLQEAGEVPEMHV